MQKAKRSCSVTSGLSIVKAGREEYEQLSRFHYRDGLGPHVAVYAYRPAVGVIVYTMPTAGCLLRNRATAGAFDGLDRSTRSIIINRNVRCVNRVIIDPRYRGLGLAARLVRETMGKLGVPVVEAMAVMGKVNPFFEKASMTAYDAPKPERVQRLIRAFGTVGIEEDMLLNAANTHEVLCELDSEIAEFIDIQMRWFLCSYGKRRFMEPGIERTRYILSKLTDRPTYYAWFNPNVQLVLE